MKKSTLGLLSLSAICFTSYAQNNEPVIMTLNGKPINKSEFEYVYKKNSGKEVNKEQKSVKDYVDLFSTYSIIEIKSFRLALFMASIFYLLFISINLIFFSAYCYRSLIAF